MKFNTFAVLLFLLLHKQHRAACKDENRTTWRPPFEEFASLQSADFYSVEDEVLRPLAKQQVSVRRRRKDIYRFGTGHICSGYLIAPNVVISAAHCFVDQSHYDGSFLPKSDFVVALGTNNRFMDDEHTEIFEVRDIVMPMKKFNLSSYSQDIALLVLINFVCPPKGGVEAIQLATASFPVNTSCQLIGWGRPEEIDIVDLMVIMPVSLIDQQQCMQQLNLAWQPDRRCAGFLPGQQPPDSCTVDTGGPLVCNEQLAGIVSWGIKCRGNQLPAVYTDLSYYTEWLAEMMPKSPDAVQRQCFDFPITVRKEKDGLPRQIATSGVRKAAIVIQCLLGCLLGCRLKCVAYF